jgi:hypothetical protein
MQITRRGFLKGVAAGLAVVASAPLLPKLLGPSYDILVMGPTKLEKLTVTAPVFDMRSQAKAALAQWWGEKTDQIIFNAVARGGHA